jgi:hypothetical protein
MFRKQLLSKFFSSIVVSISACHSIQLAGGRGSIPRWRDLSFCLFGLFFDRVFTFLLASMGSDSASLFVK